jgi:Gpi18-like mannosyltransferase
MVSAGRAAVYAAALVVRLVLTPFFGHSWDLFIWVKSGELFYRGVNVYEVRSLTDFPWGFYTYPPGWLYWLGTAYAFSTQLNNFNLYVLVIKLPIIAADFAVAALLTKVMGIAGAGRLGLKAEALWLLNPLVIGISAVWGMFDSIAVALTLAALLQAMRRRWIAAGTLLGLGGVVKIYPLLLTVAAAFYAVYILRERIVEAAKVFAAAAAAFLLPSLPYLLNPLAFIDKILYHFGNIGSFTYWTVLSTLSPPPAIPMVSYGVFAVMLLLALRNRLKEKPEPETLLSISQLVLLAFLAVSAKVNVQYTLWILPFLIYYSLTRNWRLYKLNSALLVAAGLMFMAAAQIALAVFDLRNLGRIIISKEVEQATLGGVLLILAAVLGGTRLIALFTDALKNGASGLWTLQRVTMVVLVVVFLVVAGLFPVGKGVVLPRMPVVVGVVEGVEALYVKSDQYDQSILTNKYSLTHLVLVFGPEAVMYDGDLSKSFRYRLSNDEWSSEDIRRLALSMKEAGLKPVLGIYLKSYYAAVHYGYHGYNSTNLINQYHQCMESYGEIRFHCTLESGVTLAEVFAEKAVSFASSHGFEGVYYLGLGWSRDGLVLDSVAALVNATARHAHGKGIKVFLEVDPVSTLHPNLFLEKAADVLKQVDYVVVVTDPFLKTVKSGEFRNFTIADYRAVLEKAVSVVGRGSVLFTVKAMDIVEGWVTPAIQLQTEVEAFSTVPGVSGYAIYHVNRYLPFRLSFR